MSKSGATALGIDWTCPANSALKTLPWNHYYKEILTFRLLEFPKVIANMVTEMIDSFGKDRYCESGTWYFAKHPIGTC